MRAEGSWKAAAVFVPAENAEAQSVEPLRRFLPIYQQGLATACLRNLVPPGSLILDPFGQDPFSVLELAKAGYRVIVTANNPVTAFMLELLASSPSKEDFSQALLALEASPGSRGLSFGQQMQSYSEFACSVFACEELPSLKLRQDDRLRVNALLWKDEADRPEALFGSRGDDEGSHEYAVSSALWECFPRLPSFAIYRERILENIAATGDPLRAMMATDSLSLYSERALVLLQIIQEQLRRTQISLRQKILMEGLLLYAMDACGPLWSYPSGRSRPKQLKRPPLRLEPEVWASFADGQKFWVENGVHLTLRSWPLLPPLSGGISLFRGRLRELPKAELLQGVAGVFASLPRVNMAWSKLSGLWSAWLWGREGIGPVRNSLLKMRSDWSSHSLALQKVFEQLERWLPQGTPLLEITTELEPGFLLAGLLATSYAGFSLRSAAVDGNGGCLQSLWQKDASPRLGASLTRDDLRVPMREALVDQLKERGEPTSYQDLQGHVFFQLQANAHLPEDYRLDALRMSELSELLETTLTEGIFKRFPAGAAVERSLFWLQAPPAGYTPMADRLESVLHGEFLSRKLLTLLQARSCVNQHLGGFEHASDELLLAFLDSYGLRGMEEGARVWHLRAGEEPAKRDADLALMAGLIADLATHLGLLCHPEGEGFILQAEGGKAEFSFFPLTTACFAPPLLAYHSLPGKKLLLIPGGRANLVAYKLKRDPNLQGLLGNDWHFLKFRHLRSLCAQEQLNRDFFLDQLLRDPLEYQSEQLLLF